MNQIKRFPPNKVYFKDNTPTAGFEPTTPCGAGFLLFKLFLKVWFETGALPDYATSAHQEQKQNN